MRRNRWVVLALLSLSVALASCARPPSPFSEARASQHVRMLAETIGSRVPGTEAHRRARAYLVDTLAEAGFSVRVQETLASRVEVGRSTPVANVIAIKEGSRSEAVALVSHYDSPPDSKGAADDGLGVAVCLEAGRVLAARPKPVWSLVVALTDAEELGLMGASALVKDPVMARVRTYLNFEAVGSAPPVPLFETGPGNAWLTEAWARYAPHPYGASYTTEIYRRLPNDTDFTILARTGTPGLNFATLGNSYTYHTSRDTVDRLSDAALSDMGENTVAIVKGLDEVDITRRSDEQAIYFTVRGLGAFTMRSASGLTLAATVSGAIAWVAMLVVVTRRRGFGRLLVTTVWTLVGVAAVVGSMIGAVWVLRAVSDTLHPWYAHPRRLFFLLVVTAITAGWLLTRLCARLPERARGDGQPATIWALALPTWIGLTLLSVRLAPAATFLGSIPLLAASLLVLAALIVTGGTGTFRVSSAIALVASGLIWFESGLHLLDFTVPMFGRFQTVSPIAAHPAFLAIIGIWLAPPAMGVLSGLGVDSRRLASRSHARRWVSVALGLATALALWWSASAPAYTLDRPLYRAARYVVDTAANRAFWEVSGSEPGRVVVDGRAAPSGWAQVGDAPDVGVPLGRLGGSFLYRAKAMPVPPPVTVRGSRRQTGADVSLEIQIVPERPLLAVAIILPRDVVPLEANLAGVSRQRRWRATFSAPPASGVSFSARLAAKDAAAAGEIRAIAAEAGLPGGSGWQRLPGWLPVERDAWSLGSYFVVPVTFAEQGEELTPPGEPGAPAGPSRR